MADSAAKSGKKENLNMVVIGHVDAGKSTIMGHLLFLLGEVSSKTMHRYQKDSKDIVRFFPSPFPCFTYFPFLYYFTK